MLDWLRKKHIWAFFGGVLLTALLGALVRAPSILPAGAFQPGAAAIEFAEEPEAAQTVTQAPEGAVTVSAGNVRLFAMESEEAARGFLQQLLQRACDGAEPALRPGAAFFQNVALHMPLPGEEVISAEEAQALAAAAPGLIPIAVTTVAVEEERVPYKTETGKTNLLPAGSRMISVMGREGLSLIMRETTAVSGQSAPTTKSAKETVLWEPVMEQLLTGRYRSAKPDKEPGSSEGADGPKDVELSLKRPVKASITSNFGTRLGAMHYGIDYACKAGTAVTAPASGRVVYAAERGEYGYVLEIETEAGFVVRLARIAECDLKLGDAVETGQAVAQVAETEAEEGKPHVHMEVLYGGVAYNPRQYLS